MKRGTFTHRDWASARRVHYSRAVDSEEILAPLDRVHSRAMRLILSSILNLGRATETLRAPSFGTSVTALFIFYRDLRRHSLRK